MKYNKNKLNDILETLQAIKDFDYINYPTKDEEIINNLLNNIHDLSMKWYKIHSENYSY
ncbi:MAG: hypothetical protein M0R17_02695 [Candidatus Omnitrophica bacterium]|jgi:hypothetical protein|nr:hypothetical protein [Candidatus Omnitrophota bacterium]